MKSIITSLIFLVAFLSTAEGQPRDKVAKTPKLNYDWRPGFVSITEITGGPGLSLTYSQYSKYYYGITTIAGYQFTRNIKAGIGAGVHIHGDGNLYPLYLDARYSFSAQDFVPFIAAAGGLALKLSDIGNTWMFLNPSIGIKWVAANKLGISLSAGMMTMSGEQNRNSYASVKLGLEIKGK